MLNLYYVYLLRLAEGMLYVGITTDPARRLKEHMDKKGSGAKYTRTKTVVGMECIFQTENRSTASSLEYHLKRLPKITKEEIACTGNLKCLQEKIQIQNYVYVGKKMP